MGRWGHITARLLVRMRRHNLPRTAAAYLVSSWLILEVGHLITLILELPHWTLEGMFWLLVVGFPIAMVISWKYRPAGVEIDLPETEPASRAENSAHSAHGGHGAHHGHGGHGAGAEGGVDPLPLIVGGLVLLALLFLVAARLLGVQATEHGAEEAEAPVSTIVRTAPQNSVAVLAFANLSGDARQDYFADGLSEEVLDALADVRQLKVAARTSSFSFKGKNADAQTIGAKLGVAYVLDGSVRRDGDALRVSAQLVDTKSGFRTWSEHYDRRMADIFAVQQDIAQQVVDALKVQLGAAKARAPAGRTADPDAYDNYLRARALVDLNGGEEGWKSALSLFDASIAADPNFAAAHAGRARTLIALANAFLPADQIPEARAKALDAARRAAALAPDSADAQSTLGYTLFMANLDFAGAIGPFARSVQIGSGDADILIRYGVFATRTGFHSADGIAALQKAVALDPLNPRAQKSFALGLASERRYAQAMAAMRRALALSPNMTAAHSVVADMALLQGDLATAEHEYQAEPLEWARLTGQAILASRRGDIAKARTLLAQLARDTGNKSFYQQGQILAQIGDRDGALAALARARRQQDNGLTYLNTDPFLDPLRSLPAFRQFQAHLGVVATQ